MAERLPAPISPVDAIRSRAFMESYIRVIPSLIPPAIMNEAQSIVAAHRPEGVLPGEEPVCMAGLKPKDHGFLNGLHLRSKDEQRKIFAQKRSEYAGDPVAQQQIDVYDGDTEYHVKMREFSDALKSGNSQKEAELDAWFKEHYPNI